MQYSLENSYHKQVNRLTFVLQNYKKILESDKSDNQVAHGVRITSSIVVSRNIYTNNALQLKYESTLLW